MVTSSEENAPAPAAAETNAEAPKAAAPTNENPRHSGPSNFRDRGQGGFGGRGRGPRRDDRNAPAETDGPELAAIRQRVIKNRDPRDDSDPFAIQASESAPIPPG